MLKWATDRRTNLLLELRSRLRPRILRDNTRKAEKDLCWDHRLYDECNKLLTLNEGKLQIRLTPTTDAALSRLHHIIKAGLGPDDEYTAGVSAETMVLDLYSDPTSELPL